jgi:ankyrin repeat protein
VVYVIGRVHVEAVAASLGILSGNSTDRLDGLMRAALIGHTDAVRAFLDHGCGVNTADNDGHTLLMDAVFGGHLDTVEELLRRGAEVNAQDNNGWTALMEAVAKGRADIVRTLLTHGADAHAGNKSGWTALKTATRSGTEAARLLKKAMSDKLQFVEARPDDLKTTN